MYTLVLHPDEENEERIPFSVSEHDLDGAVDYGRSNSDGSMEQQMNETAIHKIIELEIDERIIEHPWILFKGGTELARNH